MKKVSLIIFIVMVILVASSLSFAATITGSTVIGTTQFTPSAKVTVKVVSDQAGTQYGATSAHVNGTFEYGTCGGNGLSSVCDPAKMYKNPYNPDPRPDPADPTEPQPNGSHVQGWSE